MKMIIDVDQLVHELSISKEAFAGWKATQLEGDVGKRARWTALEDSGFLDRGYKAEDLKIG